MTRERERERGTRIVCPVGDAERVSRTRSLSPAVSALCERETERGREREGERHTHTQQEIGRAFCAVFFNKEGGQQRRIAEAQQKHTYKRRSPTHRTENETTERDTHKRTLSRCSRSLSPSLSFSIFPRRARTLSIIHALRRSATPTQRSDREERARAPAYLRDPPLAVFFFDCALFLRSSCLFRAWASRVARQAASVAARSAACAASRSRPLPASIVAASGEGKGDEANGAERRRTKDGRTATAETTRAEGKEAKHSSVFGSCHVCPATGTERKKGRRRGRREEVQVASCSACIEKGRCCSCCPRSPLLLSPVDVQERAKQHRRLYMKAQCRRIEERGGGDEGREGKGKAEEERSPTSFWNRSSPLPHPLLPARSPLLSLSLSLSLISLSLSLLSRSPNLPLSL